MLARLSLFPEANGGEYQLTPELHILGIDPGGTTGWCLLTIPTLSIFGDAPSAILDFATGEFLGNENQQADKICEFARTTQSLSYKVGPALVVEQWDFDPSFNNSDQEPYSPLRIGAKLGYAQHLGKLGDATLNWQGRVQAKKTATDERLRAWGLYTRGSDHERDATRHAITALRRTRDRTGREWARALWPYAARYYWGQAA